MHICTDSLNYNMKRLLHDTLTFENILPGFEADKVLISTNTYTIILTRNKLTKRCGG